MSYKVGDKVRVKSNLEAGKRYPIVSESGAIESVFCNANMLQFAGKFCTIKRVIAEQEYELVEDKNGYIYCDSMFVGGVNMTLSDLKNGMVVKTRDGKLGMIHGARILFEKTHTLLTDYKMDLTRNDDYRQLDIIAIYRSDRPTSLNTFFRVDKLIKLWERAPEVEMTVAQIEEKLGYKIKIVSEE